MAKIFQVLRALNPSEFHQLDLYFHSPYFPQQKDTLQFFDLIAPFYPNFESLSFEFVAGKWPHKELSPTTYNLLKSYILKQVYNFLAIEELSRSNPTRSQLLIDGLKRRNLLKEAERQLDMARRQLEERSPMDSLNFLHAYVFQEKALDLVLMTNSHESQATIGHLFKALDDLYTVMQMKYLIPALTLHRITKEEFPQDRWESLASRMGADFQKQPILAQINHHLLWLLHPADPLAPVPGDWDQNSLSENQSLLDFHEKSLIKLIDQYALVISPQERFNIYGGLQNYFTQRQAEGHSFSLEKLFAILQRMDREGLVFQRGKVTEQLVRNIVITGSRIGATDWTQDFLYRHRSRIVAELGENIFCFSQAFLSFYIGDFTNALKMMQKVRFTDPFYRTGYQALLLRIYYETKNYEALEGLAHTFRRFLNRSRKISERQKDFNRNFISILLQLIKVSETGLTLVRRNKIETILQNEAPVTDRTWLKAKYQELNKSS